jgi:hypothetical protein
MSQKKISRQTWIPAILLLLFYLACDKKDNTWRDYENKAGNFSGNALQYLLSQPGVYDSLLLLMNRLPRIADTAQHNEITLFAISNRSFALALQNINQARHDSIPVMPPISFSTIDSATLDTFFCRYLLQGKHATTEIADLADGLFFPTIQYKNRSLSDTGYTMQMQFARTNASGFVGGGPNAIIYSDPKGSIFYRYWVRVNTITVDINTSNAVVHVLPPGHDFGFGNEFIRAVNKR